MTNLDKPNKWLYGWKLYSNYGDGWDYETFEYTLHGYLTNKRAYRLNSNGSHRWSRGRELNKENITPRQIMAEQIKAREEYRKESDRLTALRQTVAA